MRCVSSSALGFPVDGLTSLSRDGDSSATREWLDPNLVKQLVGDYIEFSGDCFHCWACRLCKECFASLPTVGGKFDDQARERKCRGTRRHFNKILIQYYTILEENESSLDFLSERILD